MTQKKQGKPYKLEEREGRTVRVYESGAVLDHATGKIAAPVPGTTITVENTAQFHRYKTEKTANAVAEAIAKVTAGKLKLSDLAPEQAVAATAGILWRDIVLDDGVYPRDRLQGFDMLTQRARLLAKEEAEPERVVRHVLDVPAGVLDLLQEAKRQRGEVVDGETVE